MMEILRIIIVSLAMGWLSWFIGKKIIKGIRTGTIQHTDSKSVCNREKNPIFFVFLVALFSCMEIMLISVWSFVVIDAIKKLK